MIELNLLNPSSNLFPSFQNFLSEMKSHGETIWSSYAPREGESGAEFAARLLRQRENPDAGLVPESIFWAVIDGEVAGRISLRHKLEGNLHKIGGHIGYEVRPKFRRQGVATEMLRQLLLRPETRAIGKVLLTCAPENVASNKTILANGGALTQTIFVETAGADRNHYWIETALD